MVEPSEIVLRFLPNAPLHERWAAFVVQKPALRDLGPTKNVAMGRLAFKYKPRFRLENFSVGNRVRLQAMELIVKSDMEKLGALIIANPESFNIDTCFHEHVQFKLASDDDDTKNCLHPNCIVSRVMES